MQFPNKETVERLRKEYPEGTRIELVSMNDSYSKLKPGDRGTVKFVDDIGTIHPVWDCGSSLGIAYGEDYVKKLDSVVTICYGKREVWDSREEAARSFLKAMAATEGSESQRYANVYTKILMGLPVCDEED